MRFYVSNQDNPADRNRELWKKPLPVSRQGGPLLDDGLTKKVLTYGEYFSAVEAFIHTCPEYISNVKGPSPDNVSVYLEKHGAFYHPSRITVSRGSRMDEYVLNVAFSKTGREYLENEYETLKMLEKKYGYSFLPKVYACREIAVDLSRTVSMFMGEWFSAYHEFHVSDIKKDNSRHIRVWDSANNRVFMTTDQGRSIYEQAAMILTACYDIQTFEQISAWHHAAGDFVVNLDEQGTPYVKLVTVRRYAPLLNVVENNAEAVLNGLLLFLLNMSIHMRLDRLDGVKDLCWIDDFIVAGSLEGFFSGLAFQQKNERIPMGFSEYFKSFLTEITAAEMRALFVSIGENLPSGSPDLPVIQPHLQRHADAFFRQIRTLI
ncbi:MAG: hypothetical protein DRH90_23180 [Deltaproteobacteria bacterium]|nr:MAG: hypothetical protein DRH90_23180 [Deltaproteobacteria bacterium]RLC12125.1 MAG: hypothetical protein DRI24_17815 [Deltaproteobacteria bacterium]HHE73963.1 hypothetical protein [Desulfobacteraceae bacterium]